MEATDQRAEALDRRIEAAIRAESVTAPTSTVIKIEEQHVLTVSRRLGRKSIKATSVRGWVARAVFTGGHRLWETREGEKKHKWASDEELHTWALEERILWTEDTDKASVLRAELDRRVAMNTVRVWLEENEEASGPPQILRGEKQKQLRMAKKRTFELRGGSAAYYAVLALMTHAGEVVLESDPNRRNENSGGQEWLREAASWMVKHGWLPEHETPEGFARDAEAKQSAVRDTQDETRYWILDMGEGWGGIRRAVSPMIEGVTSVGADRRGFTSIGKGLPKIISRITTDFSTPINSGYSNLLRKVSKLSVRPLSEYLMVWLSVECTLYSQACYMGVTAGTAHGKAALHPANIAAAPPEQIEHEMELLIESHLAIENQLSALIQEPYTLFALECSDCDMWSLPVVEATMAMMVTGGHWYLHEVDQCAFGRLEKKPTKILTNIEWSPAGITSKPGCCVVGECAGTMGNALGDHRHRGRVMQDSQAWRSEQKITAADRRGLNTKAYNNEVACPMVREIVRAAIAMGGRAKWSLGGEMEVTPHRGGLA